MQKKLSVHHPQESHPLSAFQSGLIALAADLLVHFSQFKPYMYINGHRTVVYCIVLHY